jgi:photosynthetic reaction center cytochrome c subunit
MIKLSKGLMIPVVALMLALNPAPARPQASSAEGAQPTPKKAEEVYKNIQVLKGVPADQIIPAMQFIAASLGVQCTYCHVEHAFDKDDKENKKTARKMMQMMFAIDKDNFSGRQDVTCNTCHNGTAKPAAIPVIASAMPMPQPARAEGGEMRGGMNPKGGAAAKAPAVKFPSIGEVLNKYVQALGGAEALARITTRVEKGTLSGFGPHSVPIEIYSKAPDKRVSITQMQHGPSYTAFNGQSGWMTGFGGHIRDMEGAEIYAARLDADFQYLSDVRKVFRGVRMTKPEKIGGKEMWVLLGITPGQPPVKLYFDKDSGLLVREVRYAQTPVGRYPTQVDFADYREADGVRVPFRWTIARPGNSFTIQVSEIQQNVPLDDSKFEKPAAPPEPKPQGE